LAESRGQINARRLGTELLGLVFWGASAYLLMSLLSYSPSDPSFNRAGGSGPVRNWGGLVGAYLSDLLLQGLGLAALVLPALGAWLGWEHLRLKGLRWRPLQWIGLGLGLLVL
jgi:S-DNA-T family DNA segregation ATPase FtsK/SpoIIIE